MLLVDADTVTGHVTTSLGIDAVRTVADSWRDEAEGGPVETLTELAAAHPSGMKVVSLTSSPLNTEILEPTRVADAISAARRGFDFVVVDLHPSYSALNQAIFEKADRILVPVTPDVPAIRAAVQLRDVATETGLRDRLALVVNRANSGVSVADHGADGRDAGPGPHPVRRPALRPRRQRGPHRHRDVPQGEDHRGLRRPRRSAAGNARRGTQPKPGLRSSAARSSRPSLRRRPSGGSRRSGQRRRP